MLMIVGSLGFIYISTNGFAQATAVVALIVGSVLIVTRALGLVVQLPPLLSQIRGTGPADPKGPAEQLA